MATARETVVNRPAAKKPAAEPAPSVKSTMPTKTVFSGSIQYVQILNENGDADRAALPDLKDAEIVKLYEAMTLVRLFDQHAFLLQREGRMSTYAPSSGQEAIQVASALALKPTDWMVQAYRENGALAIRGIPLENVLLYWGGDEAGNFCELDKRTLPIAVPIATQLLHAVGVAHAMRIKGEKDAVIAFSGDGSTSEGDFNVALNWAGAFKLPVVFVVQNNQYAISLPRSQQTAAQSIAQKAFAFGIEGVQVDGNDLFASYKIASEALKKARRGEGATLIEAVTYRLSDHTTTDDASRYRTQEEVESWKKKDPILRLRKWLTAQKLWDDAKEAALAERNKAEIKAIIHRFESAPQPDIADMFRYTYEEMPPHLQEQLDAAKKAAGQ